jgi:2-keto-4-pentenoate hydratase/2-oxohepta-3-ene-1,7-dioic acid hydratase in catechol pathway
MKLVTYAMRGETAASVGCVTASADAIVSLSEDFPDMLTLVEGGAEATSLARRRLSEGRNVVELADVELRAPLLPKQMRDAMAFELHFRQSMDAVARMRVGPLAALARALGITKIPRVWYQQPVYYKCNRLSVVGPDADVVWPAGARLMDYECEVAIVIGRTGKDVPRGAAMDHVFGYTIYNDMTARDWQLAEMAGRLGPAKGKDFDTGNVLGPWLVTADEVDPYALTMIARVNGEERGRGFSRDMFHRWENIVAHVSRSETLHAGEVIGSGTVGNGCGLESGRFLDPGDIVELEVTGLGTLRNRLVRP